MQCTAPQQMRHPKTLLWLPYPCGQCTNCRIKKQSSWTLRNLLEYRTARTGQFWTLTLDDPSLLKLADIGPKKMMRSFLLNLQQSERRASNPNPIRFYGCYELGELSGRPHFHMLFYNLEKNKLLQNSQNTKWENQHMPLWPYGHVDVGHITPASIRYVSDYMMKLNPNGEASSSIPFRTRLPAIGYYGIAQTLITLAGQSMRLPSKPAYFQIGKRKYPLDTWTKNTVEKLRKKLGISYEHNPEPMERKHDQLAFEAAKDEYFWKLEFLKNREIQARQDLNHGKKKALRQTYQLRKLLSDPTPQPCS